MSTEEENQDRIIVSPPAGELYDEFVELLMNTCFKLYSNHPSYSHFDDGVVIVSKDKNKKDIEVIFDYNLKKTYARYVNEEDELEFRNYSFKQKLDIELVIYLDLICSVLKKGNVMFIEDTENDKVYMLSNEDGKNVVRPVSKDLYTRAQEFNDKKDNDLEA